ncbi:MAG TPA: DUF167 domain-containing protein [Polyangiaceae bacterium]|nr:DUF167 domain-containing protein [Polyangiaceae bacterium]
MRSPSSRAGSPSLHARGQRLAAQSGSSSNKSGATTPGVRELSTGRTTVSVKVKPRASKSRILGLRDGALEVAVAAPPVDGEANAELLKTLATRLGVPKSQLEITSGATGRLKRITVSGLDEDELWQRLEIRPSPEPGG